MIRVTAALFVLTTFFLVSSQSVAALSEEQLNLYNSGIYAFDANPGGNTSSCDANLSGTANIEKAYNFLISKGLSPVQSAGVVGNMMLESGVEPQRLQGTPPGKITPAESFSGSSGWGIVQWTPGSKFIDKIVPVSQANDLAVQLDFLWNQLLGTNALPEKQAGDDIKSASTLKDAVLAFQGNRNVGGTYTGFERPADENATVGIRLSNARSVLTKYGSTSGANTTNNDPCSSSNSVDIGSNFKLQKLSSPLSTPGGQIDPKGITLHWWGNDSNGQGISFLVNALRGNASCGVGGCSVQIGITDDGKVYQMTKSLTDLTYHAIGGNKTTIGIEIEGGPSDFGSSGVNKYPQKFAAVVSTVKYLMKTFNIPADGQVVCDDVSGVHPHKAYNSCPNAIHKEDIDDAYFSAVMKAVKQ